MKIVSNDKIGGILLSISILTRNQHEEVRRAIESMLFQISKENKEIEIVINDNSDNLETKHLIENNFLKSYIRYFKNEGERTFDANVLNAINHSRGEYVWLFGDDEIEPGAISAILKIIKNNKYNFIFTNFYIADQGPEKPVVNLNSDEIVDNGSIVLEKVANVLGFISSNIIKKDCLLNINNEKMNKFMGFGFVNFYVVLHALSLPGLFYLCSSPNVRAHTVLVENMTEKYKRDAFRSFVSDMPDIIDSFKGKFDQKSVKKLLAKSFGHIWRGELVGNVKRGDIPIKRLKTLFKFYWSFPEFWIAIPFFLMPRFVNIFFYKLYKKLIANSEFIKKRISKVPWF